ncbi:MAG: outer membrane lipoprotein carrier protein LolA [Candidatus Hydrogenedentes bacterium]|nr:outer membrane lipoprotein carrier protein LolA [Candidatus Hydrogenedentota bacterium]
MFVYALLLSLAAAAQETAPAPAEEAKPAVAPVAAFLAEFAEKREHIQGLTARFLQENVTEDETTPSTGEIVYAKPRRILFRYADPSVTYLIEGLRVYEYDEQLEQVQIFDLGDDPQAEALFLGFDSDTTRLKEAYEIALGEPEKPDCGKKGLELTPRLKPDAGQSDTVTPLFNKVRLTLREGDYLPCFIHVFNDDDSEVRISVSDISVNSTATPMPVELLLPEGTRIIENEESVKTVGPGGMRIPEGLQSNPAPEPAAGAEPKP